MKENIEALRRKAIAALLHLPDVGLPIEHRFWMHPDYPALDRIVLVIDPQMRPRQVEEAYRDLRKELNGGRRFRRLSVKHLHLAMIPEVPAHTLEAKRLAWNKQHPKWKYALITNFGRDLRAAKRRLIGL